MAPTICTEKISLLDLLSESLSRNSPITDINNTDAASSQSPIIRALIAAIAIRTVTLSLRCLIADIVPRTVGIPATITAKRLRTMYTGSGRA